MKRGRAAANGAEEPEGAGGPRAEVGGSPDSSDPAASELAPYRDPCPDRRAVRSWGASCLPGRLLFAGWVLAVNWPVVRWYGARLGDGGDEPWGLVALAAALGLTPRGLWRARMADTRCALGAAAALAAAAGAESLPMLVRAGLVAVALAAVIGAGAGAAGRAGLLLLSLPVMATAQFYAGYPLRVVTAELGRPLLALAGVATERVGVVLSWAGGEVIVDAPCSGVRMLWAGAALACGLAAWRRLTWARACLLVAGVTGGVIVANALRAAVLFLVESGVWPSAAWVHEGVGAAAFAAVALGAMTVAARWGNRAAQSDEDGTQDAPGDALAATAGRGASGRRRLGVLAALGVGALAWPLLAERARDAAPERVERAGFPGWPERFEGKLLIPLANEAEARGFAGAFPGRTQVFHEGGRVVVLRWLSAATRAVHPAADCFRARGYRVEPKGLVLDAAGARWSEFAAVRGEERWRVRERWRDPESGAAWTDVSAWWWAAQRGSTRGPWWAETVAWKTEGDL